MARRVSCPRLVGRRDELAQLQDALKRAVGGEPATVFVHGEAGVGKTRLVRELADRARDEGVRVWTGHCVPLADGLLPYAPIVDALRAAGADLGVDRLREIAGPRLARLATLVPELRDLGAPDIGEPASPAGLHADVQFLLERLAVEPTVLVLEDLHWADPSTGALLSLLVRCRQPCRLLLICTYRDDEWPPTHPLRSLLAELSRGPVDRLPVGRLDLADTADQVAGILPDPPAPDLVRRVFDRSGGNPFLAEELIAAGLDADALPTTLTDVLLSRIRELPPVAQAALHVVALAGRSTEHTLLADVVDATPDDLNAGLAAAVHQHILVPAQDRYAFRHALVAEAVVADTLPGVRIRLHRRLAESLARRTPADGWSASARAELAHHWVAAGDPAHALATTVDAGLAAEAALAPTEARRHFERSLALWWQAPQAQEATGLDLVGLYQHAAEAAYLDGDVDAALTLVHQAIAHIDAATDPQRAGMLHLRLGRYLLVAAHDERDTVAAYVTAADLVPVEPSAERASVTCGLASVLMMAARHHESAVWARASVAVSHQIGAAHEEAHALSTLGYDLTMVGELEEGLKLLRAAIDLGAQLDRDGKHRCATCNWRTYANLSSALQWAGRFAEAADVAMRGVESSRQYGTGDTFGVDLLGTAVSANFWQGRWDELADRLPKDPDQRGHALTITRLWLPVAALHTARGNFDEAQRFLDATRQIGAAGGHFEVRVLLDLGLAELALWQSEPLVARARVADGLSRLDDRDHPLLLARLLATGARADADLATDTIRARLAETSSRPALTPYSAALLAQARAELARLAGNASLAWAEAATNWSELGAPYPLAYARWRQAEAALAEPRRRQHAAQLLGEARAVARDLTAQPLSREIELLSRRARLDIAEPRSVSRPQRPHGITPREEEVLALLSQGSTNRQIARQLFIAEKTVSIHVSNILAKLGVPNRSAATAAAIRLGLLEP